MRCEGAGGAVALRRDRAAARAGGLTAYAFLFVDPHHRGLGGLTVPVHLSIFTVPWKAKHGIHPTGIVDTVKPLSRSPLSALALLALACVAWARWSPNWPLGAVAFRRAPLRSACWYWHRPFRLTSVDSRWLRAARIDRLYVYAGTLVARGGELRLIRTQQWKSQAPCELYAVVRVHPEANAALLAPAGAKRVAALLGGELQLRNCRGIQWDADVPTARLGEYARFLRELRPLLPAGLGRTQGSPVLSVTALPDWLGTKAYDALCDAVDEVAPQFYGNRWPRPGARPPALWETRNLSPAIRSSARGRARVWVGLPAYGRCVVVDAAGRPIGVRHDLDADRLLEDPAWEVWASATLRERWRGADHGDSRAPGVPVEDTLVLRCREPALAGPFEAPAGTRLWFQWPRTDGLRAAIREIQATAPAGVEGVCFFRWPDPGEPLALPMRAMADAVSTEESPGAGEPKLELRLSRRGSAVSVTVRNPGADSPLLGEEVSLVVTPPRGGVVLADGPVAWETGNEPASAARGERALFSRPVLRPGRSWAACRIESARGPVQAIVRWQGADGRRHEVTACEREVVAAGAEGARAEGLP